MDNTSSLPNTSTESFNLTTIPANEGWPRFSDGVHTVTTIYLMFIAFTGTGANGSVILLFVKNKSLRNPMNLVFVNLACSDLTLSFCIAFVQGMGTGARWYFEAGSIGCDLYGFIAYLAGEASLVALTVIAVERYLTVIRPFNMGPLTYGRAVFAIIFIWVFALVWSGAPLVGWSSYIPEGLGTWCSVDWRPYSYSNILYIILLFLISYVLPIILIVGSYMSVWMKVREMAKAASATKSSEKAEKAIAKMSFIMVSLYLVAWSPYAIVSMMAAFGPPGTVTNGMAALPALFAKSACIYNPIIYIGMNKAFRHAFFMMILKRDPFDVKEADVSGEATVGGGGNKVAPTS